MRLRAGGSAVALRSIRRVLLSVANPFTSHPGENFAPQTLARRITSEGKIFWAIPAEGNCGIMSVSAGLLAVFFQCSICLAL